MLRRFFIFLLLGISGFGFLYSQQITKFAVIDLPAVYTAFFRESQAVRQWEERRVALQREIDRMNRNIQSLRTRHADAIQKGDQAEVINLENQINRETENIRAFFNTRTEQLERERANLMQSSSFLSQVHDGIRFVAESEGFSMVLNLKDNPSILYYHHSVDITERVIQRLNRTRN